MLTVSFLNISTLFLDAYCVVVHKPFHPIFEEKCRLWSNPHKHHVLNFLITGKYSSMEGLFNGQNMELGLDCMVGVEVQLSGV